MKNFKDLIVWHKAHALVLYVYKLTARFPQEEKYNLTSQIRRSATSIPTNAAEGCGKFKQTDFTNYLQIALGSSHEVEYLAFLSYELGYFDDEHYKSLDLKINEVKAMLIGLVTKVRKGA